MKTSAKTNARRNGVLRSRLSWRMQRVPNIANRMQQRNGKRPIHFSAQSADVGFNNAGLGIEVKAPDAFEKHGARNNATLVAHQEFEQFEMKSRR